MPRKGPAPKRVIIPDPIYRNEDVTRFINRLMLDGKKSVAEKIFYQSLEKIEERAQRPGIEVFQEALRERHAVRSRSSLAVSVARRTRCRSKSGPSAARPLAFAG